MGFTAFLLFFVGFFRFYWVLLGFTGFESVGGGAELFEDDAGGEGQEEAGGGRGQRCVRQRHAEERHLGRLRLAQRHQRRHAVLGRTHALRPPPPINTNNSFIHSFILVRTRNQVLIRANVLMEGRPV